VQVRQKVIRDFLREIDQLGGRKRNRLRDVRGKATDYFLLLLLLLLLSPCQMWIRNIPTLVFRRLVDFRKMGGNTRT
jgi:hypothetical protein